MQTIRVASCRKDSRKILSSAPQWPPPVLCSQVEPSSRASTSYSSVLEQGWDLSSPQRPALNSQQPSPLPAKSPLLPDFAAEDYDDWATSLLGSIPTDGNGKQSSSSPQGSSDQAQRASLADEQARPTKKVALSHSPVSALAYLLTTLPSTQPNVTLPFPQQSMPRPRHPNACMKPSVSTWSTLKLRPAAAPQIKLSRDLVTATTQLER